MKVLFFLSFPFVIIFCLGISLTANATTFTVNSTADTDDGSCTLLDCTLREAINAANATSAADDIEFNIGSGTPTISVGASLGIPLPALTQPVTINGSAGPGGATRVELNGTNAGASANGLTISGGSSIIKRLVINNFGGDGILIQTNNGNVIRGNFIGMDATGDVARPNKIGGIQIQSDNNLIGGTTGTTPGGACTGDCNLISGNGGTGIYIGGSSPLGNQIRGNFIGTDVSGTQARPNVGFADGINTSAPNTIIGGSTSSARNVISGNGGDGIDLTEGANGTRILGNFIGTDTTGTQDLGNNENGVQLSSANNIIGGTTPADRNIISGNGYRGIRLHNSSATGNTIQGNFIGTDVSGTTALGNSNEGVIIDTDVGNTTLGGTVAGAGNVISNNASHGVFVVGGTGNGILRNSIFSNNLLGIDLGVGGNNDQAAPSLTSALSNGVSTEVDGELAGTPPSTNFRIEFFSNLICDPSGFGEGQTFIGFINLASGGGGTVPFNAPLPPVSAGELITATATDPNNNTSEFSNCETVVEVPFPIPTPTSTPNAAGLLSFSGSSIVSSDQDLAATITILRTQGSSGTVTVQFDTSDGTAQEGVDYEGVHQTVTFEDGETEKQVQVPLLPSGSSNNLEWAVLGKNMAVSFRTVNLTLTNPSAGASLGEPSVAILQIISSIIQHINGGGCGLSLDHNPPSHFWILFFFLIGGLTYRRIRTLPTTPRLAPPS